MSSPRRPPLFLYPSLPKWEIRLYTTVTIIAILYAWKCVYSASTKYTFKFGDLASISDLPIFGRRFKDETDWEWSRWSPLALRNLPHLIIYSIVFNFSQKFLSEKQWVLMTTAVSMVSVSQIYTLPLLLLSLTQGSFIFAVSEYFRKPFAVWMSSLPILYVVMNHTDLFSADPFLVLLFVSYSLLSYISFNLEITSGFRRPEDPTALDRFVRMLFYTFYQPYLISLIVLYPDFEQQIANRSSRRRDWSAIVKLGLRIAVWWILLELILHFFYFGSMLADAAFAQNLPKNEFVTLGMAVCNFFHLKYVIIFGVPTVFAMIDGMEPKEGPICIARIALISKVWRYFDRGLYEFFKKYIFVPICFPSFSLGRKIVGLVVSYTFVLLWHGFLYHNIPPPQFAETSRHLKRRIKTANATTLPIASTSAAIDGGGSGLQGISVGGVRLPEPTLRQHLSSLIASARTPAKLIDISVELGIDGTQRSLLLLQNVHNIDALIAELNTTTWPDGDRLHTRLASHVAVTEAHNTYLVATAGALSSFPPNSLRSAIADPRHKDACRTLYVGKLERNIRENVVKQRFARFGHILDVDVKNRETLAPFAFVQFADIEAAANAIFECQPGRPGIIGSKGERLRLNVNWGRPNGTSKLWIGALPSSCTQENLLNQIRSKCRDFDAVFDPIHREALIVFRNVEAAQMVHNLIRSRSLSFDNTKEGSAICPLVDFASDKLHDYFLERKFGRIPNSTKSTALQRNSDIQPEVNEISCSAEVSDSLLAPPPDPPPDLALVETLVESADSMSSRHSHSRRSSPERRDHRRDRGRRSGHSRRHHSRSPRRSREDRKRHSSSHSRRRHLSTSSTDSSGRSVSSDSSRSSESQKIVRSPSKSESFNQDAFAMKLSIPKSPAASSSEHPSPPLPGGILRRADAVDFANPPATELDSPGRVANRISDKPLPNGHQPHRRSDSFVTQLPRRFRHNPVRQSLQMILEYDVKSKPSDPRIGDETYAEFPKIDEEQIFNFPAFFHDDEHGKQFCHYIDAISQRRTSQCSVASASTTPRPPLRQHAPVSRSTSSGSADSHGKVPTAEHSFPPPPPPSASSIQSPEMRQRSDSTGFAERLHSITSKCDSLQERLPALPAATKARTLEEDLKRFKILKKGKSNVEKTAPTSAPPVPAAPSSQPAEPKLLTSATSRLSINIPISTPTSATPNSVSPALSFAHPPPPLLSSPVGRSMSFSQNLHLSVESPIASVGLAPRSSSYNLSNSPSLPIPPPPPELPVVLSPKIPLLPKLSSPSTSSPIPRPPAPPTTNQPTVPSQQFKQPTASTIHPSKSSVTSPITTTTPSTPNSASSDSKIPSNRPLNEERKKKTLQNLKVPKKARDSAEQIFSFSSPLSRNGGQPSSSSSSTTTTVQTNGKKIAEKPTEKPKHSTETQPKKEPLPQALYSKLTETMERIRKQSAKIIEQEMLRFKQKAAKKFNNEKDREKYIKEKQEKLKGREAERLKDKEKKKIEEFRRIMEERKMSDHSKSKETKEKERQKEKERLKEKEKQKPKPRPKKRPRTPPESGSDAEESEDHSSEIMAECGLRDIDLEMQRILLEEAKNGQLNLSMYERVKRKRLSQVEEAKKSQTLEILREKAKKKEKKAKRVQLASSDESDSAAHNSSKARNSDSDEHSEAETTITNTSAGSASKKSLLKKFKTEKLQKMKEEKLKKREQKLLKAIKKEEMSDSDEHRRTRVHEVSGSESDELAAKRMKKSAKTKSSSLLKDDDFCANSDDGGAESSDFQKKVTKIYTGKPGRPREKIKIVEPKRSSPPPDKSEHKKIKQRNEKTLNVELKPKDKPKEGKEKKQKEGTKKKTESEEEKKPLKKKSSIDEKERRKRRRVSDTSDVGTDQSKRSKTISETREFTFDDEPKSDSPTPLSFAAISPSPSTSSENVRLENFVTQNCGQSTESSTNAVISALESRKDSNLISSELELLVPNGESKSAETQRRRSLSTSSSSTSASSSTSSASTSSSANTSIYKSPLHLNSAAEEPISVMSSSISTLLPVTSSLPTTTTHTKALTSVSLSPSRLMEELQFDDSSPSVRQTKPAEEVTESGKERPTVLNEEDDDVDYEAMLVSEMSKQSAEVETTASVAADDSLIFSTHSQETEDAIESITALMKETNGRSDDDEEEHFAERRQSHSSSRATSNLLDENEHKSIESPINAKTQSERRSSLADSISPPPKESVSQSAKEVQNPEEETKPIEKSSPITSLVATVARGENSDVDVQLLHRISPTTKTTPKPTVTHLPTPPPSRSSENSPSFPQISVVKTLNTTECPIAAVTTESVDVRPQISTTTTTAPTTIHLGQPASQQPIQSPTTFASLNSTICSAAIRTEPSTSAVPIAEPMGTSTSTAPSHIPDTAPTSQSFPQFGTQNKTNELMSLLSSLSGVLGPNPPAINQGMIQQLITSPQFLSQIPQLDANPHLMDLFLQYVGSLYNQQSSAADPTLLILQKLQQQRQQLEREQFEVRQRQQNEEKETAVRQQYAKLIQMSAADPNQATQLMHMLEMAQENEKRAAEEAERQRQEVLKQKQEAAFWDRIRSSGAPVIQEAIRVRCLKELNGAENTKSTFWLNEERYPVCWQGSLSMKSDGTKVQMHRVCGNQQLIGKGGHNVSSIVRINQRMRLKNPHLIRVCDKMNNEKEFAALLCFPCGRDAAQLLEETSKMNTKFIEYLTSKTAAGVALGSELTSDPECIVHIFPPGDFAAEQLKRLAPDIFYEMQSLRSAYLFVVITTVEEEEFGHNGVLKPDVSVGTHAA